MWIKGLDGTDNKIINLLQGNGRMSYSEIGNIVGLSRTSVKNRISELEEKGIISGYRAIINPQNAPEMMTFIMNVETQAEQFENAKKKLMEAEETVTIIQTTGNCHLVVICQTSTVQEMRIFVNKAYKEIEGITSINAHAVLDILKGSVIPEK
jgi:DNA-binding Lrp family transcriptional regulator